MEVRGMRLMVVGLAILAAAAAGCATQSGSGSGGGSGSGSGGSSGGNWFSRWLQGGGSNGTSNGTESEASERGGMLHVAERGGAGGQGFTRNGRDPMGRPSPTTFSTRPELKDIYFDFDKAEIRPEARRTLDETAAWLRSNPQYLVLIEGHADERGTNAYNIALGDRRAKAAMNYLVGQGVRSNRISTISYGEERPMCSERTDHCWSLNRRAHFAVLDQ